MSFLNLKKREDRWLIGIFVFGVVMLSISQGVKLGWWALLTVPAYIVVIFIVMGLTRWLIARARRRDLEEELAKLEGRPYEPRETAWTKLWTKRGR